MKFTNERDIVELLVEARVIDASSSRAARRAQIQRARAVLGSRDWTPAEACAAVRFRTPCREASFARVGLQRIDGLSQLGTGRMLR